MTLEGPTVSYTIAGAAKATGHSDKTIRRALADGSLVAHYPTSRPVILADDLRAWVTAAPTQQRAAS